MFKLGRNYIGILTTNREDQENYSWKFLYIINFIMLNDIFKICRFILKY